MVFWIGILVGAVFAWSVIKMGFYETWAFLFNTIISIYLAISLGPIISDIIPAASGDTPYGNALAILAAATAILLILQGIIYVLFTSQFSISFPRILDILGSGFLGFLAGFLIWSFVTFLICTIPIQPHSLVAKIGFTSRFNQTNISYLSWWCGLLDTLAAPQDSDYPTKQTINELLEKAQEKIRKSSIKISKPAEFPDTNDMEIEKEPLPPPPPPPEIY